MTIPQLRKILEEKGLPDSWWVAIDGDIAESYENTAGVREILQSNPSSTVSVLHTSDSDSADAEWLFLDPPIASKVKLAGKIGGAPAVSRDEFVELDRSISSILETVVKLENRVVELSSEVQEVREGMKQLLSLKDLFEEVIAMEKMRTEFEKQREFIEECERQLLTKTMEHEEAKAEFEQSVENFDRHTA